jgi:hypothetical protein
MPRAHPLRLRRRQAAIWRAVEAQHVVSTMRLVDNDLEDQKALENLIEAAKPQIPPEARELHWLLFTPFRYPPRPGGSRFRGPGDPGVFYGAYERRTACAESGYWRWKFVQDSAGLSKLDALPMSVFQAHVRTQAADLTLAPYVAQRGTWMDPINYASTQAFARAARMVGAGAIVYESVRDPEHGRCMAVLRPQAFLPGQSPQAETWYLTVGPTGSTWTRTKEDAFSFSFA